MMKQAIAFALLLCLPGSEQLSCQQVPSPCFHGTCTDVPNIYKFICRCESGWAGHRCDIDLNVNIARRQPAFLSSETHGAKAALAVDWNLSPNFFNPLSRAPQCTHTRWEQNPWWAVGFGWMFQVQRVKIINRGDCCGNRLSKMEIGTTNNNPIITKPTPSNIKFCASLWDTAGLMETRYCSMFTYGRYLVIILLRMSILTLCEVQVWGSSGLRNNVALKQPALQSSTYALNIGNADAGRAVDGNKDQNMDKNSCSQTNSEDHPWWAVNLGTTINLGVVVITNRGFNAQHIENYFEIIPLWFRPRPSRRYTIGSMRKCAKSVNLLSSYQTAYVQCLEKVSARYVMIMLHNNRPTKTYRDNELALCEVEVYTYEEAEAFLKLSENPEAYRDYMEDDKPKSNESPPNSPTANKNIPVIAGVCSATVLCVIIVASVLVVMRMKKAKEEAVKESEETPYKAGTKKG